LKIVHFLGYSGSGKTFTISCLIRELSKAGKNIGTLKHVHSQDFSIDRRGKDSWIFKKSGASVMIVLSPHESVVIRQKRIGSQLDSESALDNAFRVLKKEKLDYLFVEGFNNMLEKKPQIKRIVCARNEREMEKLLKLHKKVDCIVGKNQNKFRLTGKHISKISVLFLPKNKTELIQIIS